MTALVRRYENALRRGDLAAALIVAGQLWPVAEARARVREAFEGRKAA
jgi:hypothetical protein